MRISLFALALLVLWQGSGVGATRTWKDRKGNEIKADYTGVLNGKVVLKAGSQRMRVSLSDLSLADRDYLVDLMLKRRQQDLLLQLMAAENNKPVIDPDRLPVKPANGAEGDGTNPPPIGGYPPVAGNFPPNVPVPNLPLQQPAVETEMYGLPLPSPELLVEDQVRTWTNLTGLKVPARFDRVLAPGFLRLKQASGAAQEFAVVNFSQDDITYVKQVLAKDFARPVFPEGSGFQSLTPEEVEKGYRVWTDRRDVPLVGKFEGVKDKSVVIEKNGEKLEYPLAGLSENDRDWIKTELRRRAEAAAARARQAAAERPSQMTSGSPFSRSPFSRGPFGAGGHGESGNEDAGGHGDGFSSRFPRSRGSLFPEYKFHCDHCGRDWTGSSPVSFCPNCKDTYEFRCNVCGHTWTRKNQRMDTCPNCNARRNNSNAGYSATGSHSQSPSASTPPATSATKKGQDVALTLLYVGLGLGLLAGIAVGLFKAFG